MKVADRRNHLFRCPSLILLLIVILLVGAGCSLGRDTIGETGSKQALPISIMVILHQTQAPDKTMLQELERETGASLEIEWIPNEIYTDKMITALDTGFLKKVIYVNQQDYPIAKKYIRSGMFWEIGPYLDAYPNLKKLDKTVLAETAIDEKIYSLYAERPASRQGVLIRADWLEKLQMKVPASIDELYTVMKGFTQLDPDGNGKHDTFGLTDRNDLLFGSFKTLGSYFGTPNNWGLQGGRLIPDFKTQEYVNTMDFLKQLYHEGILHKDFPVTSKHLQRHMLISGKAGVYVGNLADAPRIQEEMQRLNPAARLVLANRIQGPKGYGTWSMPSYSGLFLFSKKAIATEEELKAILAFYDRTMDPDVSNLLQYGIEGQHYVKEDGMAALLPEAETARQEQVMPLWNLMIASLSNPNLLKQKANESNKLQLEADRLIEDNHTILIHDPAAGLASTAYDTKWAGLQGIITDATYHFILGKMNLDEYKAEVARWEREGGDQIIQEMNDAYVIRTESLKP